MCKLFFIKYVKRLHDKEASHKVTSTDRHFLGYTLYFHEVLVIGI